MTAIADPTALSDPTALVDPTALTPPDPFAAPAPEPKRDRRHVEEELAAAFVVAALLMRRHLAAEEPKTADTRTQAHDVWKRVAPTWLRFAVPAIAQAYRLGRVEGLTEDELTALATDYAGHVGDYINTTSADALGEAMNTQLAQKWDAGLAWHRAVAAYGLDKRDMRAYLTNLLNQKAPSSDPVPPASRLLVDKALMRRASRIGKTEAGSAEQTGQALAWLWLYRNGRMPVGSTKQWGLGSDEHHCPVCLELRDQQVAPDEPFVLASGAQLWAPLAHPGCSCRLRLRPPQLSKAYDPNEPRDHGRWAKVGVGVGGATLAVAGGLAVRRFHVPPPKAVQLAIAPTRTHPLAEGIQRLDDHQARALMRSVAASRATPGYSEALLGMHGGVSAPMVRGLHGDELFGGAYAPHGRAFRRLHGAADPAATPELHRGMYNVEHQVGDIIDFGPAASFSSDQRMARNYASFNTREGRNGVYSVPAGRVPAVPVGNDQGEWLVGGKFRVVSKFQRTHASGRPYFHYEIEPHHEIGKAYDPNELRDRRGRWTEVADREQTANPLAPANPFEKVPNPFERNANPFARATDPFARTGNPFAPSQSGAFGRKRGEFARRKPKKLVRNVVILPFQGAKPEKSGRPYFLPVNDFHQLADSEAMGATYAPNDLVDFSMAASRPVASAGVSPWNLLTDDQVFTPERVALGTDPDKIYQIWGDVLPKANLAWGLAIENADNPDGPIVERLNSTDLKMISRLAGYEQEDDDVSMRNRIVKAVHSMGDGDNSLANAYADYVTWNDPKFLGEAGARLAEAMDDAEQEGVDLRTLIDFPIPIEQVFGFEAGFHPDTPYDQDEAKLHGPYATQYIRYRSSIADLGLSAPPLRIGLQEVYSVPFESKDGLWIPGQTINVPPWLQPPG